MAQDAPAAQAETLPDIALGAQDAPLTIVEYASFTCGHCGEVYHDRTKPTAKEGSCDVCGSTDLRRRADDNAESLKTRLMEYYKKTSPLIGYYYAKGKLIAVDGLAAMDEVSAQIDRVLPVSSEIAAST